jgi:hypothetical protein
VHLLAQPSLGTNAAAVANQQHPDEQFRITRRPAGRAIKWRKVAPMKSALPRSTDIASAALHFRNPAQERTVRFCGEQIHDTLNDSPSTGSRSGLTPLHRREPLFTSDVVSCDGDFPTDS